MIEKNGVRILTPSEFDRLHDAITKQDYKIMLNVALYTGMRYVELQRFQKNPEWLMKDRRCIYLPKQGQKKNKRKLRDRYVYLSTLVLNYIDLFFKIRKMPATQQWNLLLKSWVEKAGIGGNISAKTTRKTWESWLAISYPNRLDQICMNQGHTNLTAVRHYLQLPFSEEEIREIKNRTAGWMNGA